MVLEGNEVEGKIGDIGGYSVDVDDKGALKVALNLNKQFGYGVEVAGTFTLQTNIFAIAESIAKKTQTPWDDKAVALLESILGIVK